MYGLASAQSFQPFGCSGDARVLSQFLLLRLIPCSSGYSRVFQSFDILVPQVYSRVYLSRFSFSRTAGTRAYYIISSGFDISGTREHAGNSGFVLYSRYSRVLSHFIYFRAPGAREYSVIFHIFLYSAPYVVLAINSTQSIQHLVLLEPSHSKSLCVWYSRVIEYTNVAVVVLVNMMAN